MSTLLYSYTREEDEDGSIIIAPKATIRLTYKGRLTNEFYALIDSGSDATLIPRQQAADLCLPLGKEITLYGIEGKAIKGTLSEVNILFFSRKDIEVVMNVVAIITDVDEVILGRKTIFEAFRIIFTQAHRIVEMKRMSREVVV